MGLLLAHLRLVLADGFSFVWIQWLSGARFRRILGPLSWCLMRQLLYIYGVVHLLDYGFILGRYRLRLWGHNFIRFSERYLARLRLGC